MGQIFIENCLNRKEIIIEGDGNEKLDFTYIQDLLQGIVKIIKNKKSLNETFNITFGKAQPIKKLIEILKKDFPDLRVKSFGCKLPFFVGCHSLETFGLFTNKLFVLLTL